MSPLSGIKSTVYVTPLTQLLKNAGHYTIHCGKAHFASKNTPGDNPLNISFDINIAGNEIGSPESYLSKNDYGNKPKNSKVSLNAVPGLEKYYNSKIFLTESLTLEAINALKKPKTDKQPFFLYISHYAIHLPLEADERFTKTNNKNSDVARSNCAQLQSIG